MNLEKLIAEFMDQVATEQVEVYNEFSLQHELGIFLREKLTGYKIQFERNARYFSVEGTIKHEIDIVIFNDKEKYAIELKAPFNGEYPEQMFSFIKDICFMEEMRASGFDGTYCLTLVHNKCFYSGDIKDGIYAYFRARKPVHGVITKPTGKKDIQIDITGTYLIDWKNCGDMKYYCVSCSQGSKNKMHVKTIDNNNVKTAMQKTNRKRNTNKKQKILEYCSRRNEKVTARDIINALFPGQQQPSVNGIINELVQERKLVRVDTRPYTVHVPAPGEVIGPVSDYSRKKKS